MGFEWVQNNCPVCNEVYSRIKDDPYFAACYNCRTDFGCNTVEQTAELVSWAKDIKPEERTALVMGKGRHRWGGGGGQQHGGYKAPVIDREKVAAGVRVLTAYGLTWPLDAPLSLPTNYILAQNGLFEVRHSDVADIVLHLSPDKTDILGLTQKLTPGVILNIPKVPFEMLSQTAAFFRGVMKRFNNAEAIVRIWWNVSEGQYEIRVPDGGQRVAGASVHHNDTFDLADERDAVTGASKYLHVMDIHSHNNMSGFWSGVDDNDERKAPEGRMFGVFGKVTQTIPDWKWRMRAREGFIEMKVNDIFEIPDVKIDFTSAMSLSDLMVAPTVTATMSCNHDPFENAECPEEWYKTVNQPTVAQPGFNMMGFRGRGWGGHMGASEHRSSAPIIPSYIFVQVDTSEGKALEEFEVLADTVKPTGVKYKLDKGTIAGSTTRAEK